MIQLTGFISRPLTIEDVLNIIEVEKPEGVVVQFGGQTPFKACGSAGKRRCKNSWHIP